MERDQWTCRYCGEPVTTGTATLDHIVPQSLGGPNTPENLTTACLTCNAIKSGRTYEEAAPDILAALVRRKAIAVSPDPIRS
jgi:5-methylcytosine-specific restriction endonuclease McrA